MIILLILLFIVSNIVIYMLTDWADELFIFIFLLVFGILLLFLFWNISGIVQERTYNQKIEMYQSENKKIEDKVNIVVEKYMQHENETFDRKVNSMTLVSLYPGLKSDKLVQQQIELYEKNNEKIKRLKEYKIDVSTAKWWVYFGK